MSGLLVCPEWGTSGLGVIQSTLLAQLLLVLLVNQTALTILVGRFLGHSFCLSLPSHSSGLCCGGWAGHQSCCLLGVLLQGTGIVHLVSWGK